MALLQPEALRTLEMFASCELVQRWKGLEEKLSRDEIITIANTGLVNAGKSSLFNALLDKEEYFAVGAVRTTTTGRRAKMNDWIEVLDTPGIDAAENDDEEAFSSVVQADLIVAIHNIKIGMLNRAEYEWLERLARHMTRQEIEQRVIFACTWIDERDRQDDYQSVVEETKRQVSAALGTDILSFWEISAKRYINARKRGNATLEEASKLPKFREYLLKRASRARETAAQRRRAELKTLCQDTQDTLRAKKSELQYTIKQREQAAKRQFQPARDTWASILRNFASSRASVERKMQDLSRESDSSSNMQEFRRKINNLQ